MDLESSASPSAASPSASAELYRADGTRRYKEKDYAGAEASYSSAIAAEPSSVLYANRSAARWMLQMCVAEGGAGGGGGAVCAIEGRGCH